MKSKYSFSDLEYLREKLSCARTRHGEASRLILGLGNVSDTYPMEDKMLDLRNELILMQSCVQSAQNELARLFDRVDVAQG